jgi:hypothetical protein
MSREYQGDAFPSVWDREIGGSNPLAPTSKSMTYGHSRVPVLLVRTHLRSHRTLIPLTVLAVSLLA